MIEIIQEVDREEVQTDRDSKDNRADHIPSQEKEHQIAEEQEMSMMMITVIENQIEE